VGRSLPNGFASSVTSLGRHKQLDKIRVIESGHRQTTSLGSSASSVSTVKSDHAKKSRNRLTSPLVRQDIFYTGSVTSLREFKACPDMDTYVQVTAPASAVIKLWSQEYLLNTLTARNIKLAVITIITFWWELIRPLIHRLKWCKLNELKKIIREIEQRCNIWKVYDRRSHTIET